MTREVMGPPKKGSKSRFHAGFLHKSRSEICPMTPSRFSLGGHVALLKCGNQSNFQLSKYYLLCIRQSFDIAVIGHCPEILSPSIKYPDKREYENIKLEEQSYQSVNRRRLFAYNGPRLWNALPGNIRKEKNTDNFKAKLKTLSFDGHKELLREACRYTAQMHKFFVINRV